MNKNIVTANLLNNSISRFPGHPFHLVEPSLWPFVTSFSLLILTMGSVMAFNHYQFGFELLIIGLITTIFSMALWFKDIITESTFQGFHTTKVTDGISIGFGLFVTSEVMFFLSIFWAYFHSALAPTHEIGTNWPPYGITPINPYELPLLNTIILLASGCVVTYAHHALILNQRRNAIYGLILTIILAIVFTGFQVFEYLEASFTYTDSVFGSCFFLSTGFHGIHVMIGTAFLTVCLIRLIAYQLTDDHHIGLEAAILYWHFVDLVWLFLFISVYWWGS